MGGREEGRSPAEELDGRSIGGGSLLLILTPVSSNVALNDVQWTWMMIMSAVEISPKTLHASVKPVNVKYPLSVG